MFSYITVLLIPIVIISTLVYGKFINVLKQEVMTNNLNRLKKASTEIDMQLSQLDQIRSQIFLNKNLRPFYFKNSPFKAMVARDELKNYTTIHPLLKDVIIYYRGDDFLYSSTSSYTISRFINDIHRYENWSEENFRNTLLSLRAPMVRLRDSVTTYPNEKENILTFLYPLSDSSATPYGIVLFLIAESSFQRILQQDIEGYDENSIILGRQNEVLTSLRYEEYFSSNEFQNFILSEEKTNQETIILDGKNYFISYVMSPQTEWSYITLTPVEQVLSKVKEIQISFIYTLLVVLLLGGLATYYMIELNYNPIRQLKLYTENLWHQSTSSNEFEAIKNTLDHLSNENLQLYGKVIDQKTATKPYLLFQILNGHIKDQEEVNQKGKEINFYFSKDYFFTTILQIHSSQTLSQPEKQNLISSIEKQLPDFIQGYGREHLQIDKIIFVFSIEKDFLSSIEEVLLKLQQICIEQSSSAAVSIGVGKAYADFSSLPDSYLEATTALDYRFIQGNGKLIFFDHVMDEHSSFTNYPTSQITMLRQAIKQGKMENIDPILHDILDFVQNSPIPLFVARGLCFDMINSIAQALHELHQECDFSTQYPDIFSLTRFETVEELTDIIKQLCTDLNLYLEQHKELQEEGLIQDILSYLKENFSSHQFSLQNAAEEFQMSFPAFSQYFKDYSGQTLSDYVTYLRMEKTKILLVTTDMPLKDIAEDVGYTNVSSFIRRFKQLTGLTPGEYRKQYIDENNEA